MKISSQVFSRWRQYNGKIIHDHHWRICVDRHSPGFCWSTLMKIKDICLPKWHFRRTNHCVAVDTNRCAFFLTNNHCCSVTELRYARSDIQNSFSWFVTCRKEISFSSFWIHNFTVVFFFHSDGLGDEKGQFLHKHYFAVGFWICLVEILTFTSQQVHTTLNLGDISNKITVIRHFSLEEIAC